MPDQSVAAGVPLERDWYARDAPLVAAELLNKLLVARPGGELLAGRIIEVEAYSQGDPASHTFRGLTPRNAVMFGPPGHLYVYVSYGIHHCANVVTGDVGQGQAVLLRAVEPLAGVPEMRRRRADRADHELADGPGKLCQAFGIDLDDYGVDLTGSTQGIVVLDDGVAPPVPVVGPRVGITRGVETPWRFRVPF